MEQLKVTFDDKVSIVTKPVPLINKVTDADMNELKDKHNDTVDVLETIDGELTTAQEDILQLEQDVIDLDGRIDEKQDGLGITDEGTHLLTPKEIREGADPETKLARLNEIPEVNQEQFGQDAEDKVIIAKLSIPIASNTITFLSAMSDYGTKANPRSGDFTLNLTGAKTFNVAWMYLQADEVPTMIATEIGSPNSTPLKLSGDSFSVDSGFINRLKFTYFDDNEIKLEIENISISAPIDPNLIGYWTFDNDPDNNTIIDSTSFENDGVNVTTSTSIRVSGKVNNCVEMTSTSTNAGFRVPDNASFDFSNGVSVACWVRFNADTTGGTSTVGIVSKDFGISKGFRLGNNGANRKFRFELGQAASASRAESNFVYDTADIWVHVVGTYDNSNTRIYINGVLDATTAYSGSILEDVEDLYVLSSHINGFRSGSRGDEVRLYRRALSGAEILEIYELENPS